MLKIKSFHTKTLRKIHVWVGFLSFSILFMYLFTGLLLNHRTVFKIPGPHTTRVKQDIQLEQPIADIDSMRRLLKERGIDTNFPSVSKTPEKILPTPRGRIVLPEKWVLFDVRIEHSLLAEYYVGTLTLSIDGFHPNALEIVNRVHRNIGTGMAWQIFVDIVIISLLLVMGTSLFLWTKLHGQRKVFWALLASGITLPLLVLVGSL